VRCVLERPKVKRLLSTEHFSIDGTLIEAWASMKSFKLKEPDGDLGGEAEETALFLPVMRQVFCSVAAAGSASARWELSKCSAKPVQQYTLPPRFISNRPSPGVPISGKGQTRSR
jgi:hypothetical protein